MNTYHLLVITRSLHSSSWFFMYELYMTTHMILFIHVILLIPMHDNMSILFIHDILLLSMHDNMHDFTYT